MKISVLIKHTCAAAFVLGFAVACATAPEPEAECEGISPEVQAAVDDARAVVQEARDMGAEWRGARRMVNQAEAAGNDCRDEEAMQLADEAAMMAREQMDEYRAAMEDQAEEDQQPRMGSYRVRRGDSLWSIAGHSNIYGDSYQWPLIYRANTDKIDDADLIHPDQRLAIERNPSSSAVDAAVEHARNRGEWSLGEVESSDRTYLRNHGM